ncbi:MAG: PTS sugar transporter subunit IIA [Pseudomonadota bacterium]
MDHVADLLSVATTVCKVPASSRKRVLQLLSDLLAAQSEGLCERTIFEALMARERLGSTGIGEGVAIPHCRSDCDRVYCAFFQLEQPVDFEAPDGIDVDLVFVIVAPTGEQETHLRLLAQLAAVLKEPANRSALRRCDSDAGLHEQISALLRRQAAA